MAQLPMRRAHVNDLWARAAEQLSDNDKRNINFNRSDKLNILAELHADTEKARQRSVESRWKYKRKSGETVIIRDIFEKIVRWVDIFKQVGDVAIQYDPGHAALPWAGIRFVLQIAVNDINKFAAVVEDLPRIAELICRFAHTEDLYLQGTSKAANELERALVKVYASILGYLSKAKQYLEQGSVKRAIKGVTLTEMDVASRLSEIQTAEDDVHRCMVLVDKTDDASSYEKLMDLLAQIDEPLPRMDSRLKNIHDDLQASKRTEIVRWLSPEPYIQHHKQTRQGILMATGQWLLSDPLFKKWNDDSASSILWLHGIPGSGKSKLVSVVIENAMARYKTGQIPQPVFFYCSRNIAEPTRANPQAILASLARQLSCLEPGKPLMKPTVDLFKKKEKEGFASGTLEIDESLELILQLIAEYPLATIVIDAMDECNPEKRDDLLEALEQIVKNSSSLVKIFVSSRNDQDIVWRLQHYPNLELDSKKNSDDIARFVNDQTQQLIRNKKLLRYSTSKAEMQELIINKVIEGADGMFRWASMQLQYLCAFALDADIKTSLGRIPPELSTLYGELYEILSTNPGEFQGAVFKNALHWLLCAKRKMTTKEFLCAVSADPQSGRIIDMSEDLILEVCNNFIVLDSQLDTFRFAHLSVREFLEQRHDYGDTTSNALATEICLWTMLSTSSCDSARKALRELGWHATPTNLVNLCTYADLYWIGHCMSAKEQKISEKLKTALKCVLSGTGDDYPSFTPWKHWLLKHLNEHWIFYNYGEGETMEDIIQGADSALSAGLLVACFMDLGELMEDLVQDKYEEIQRVTRLGRGPLQLAIWKGSCACVASLLSLNEFRLEITPRDIRDAARNSRSGMELMKILLEQRASEVQISQEVIVAAAENDDWGKEILELLLDRRGSEVQITQEVVVAAATDDNIKLMEFMLNRPGLDVQITQKVVVAAAKNVVWGYDLMTLILDRRGLDVEITEEVVIAVARNFDCGTKLMKLLFRRRGSDVRITEQVVVAAAGNWECGIELIELFLEKRASEVKITPGVVAAAEQWECGKRVLELFLSRRESSQITEEVVVAAVKNPMNSIGLMKILLNQQGSEVQITPEVVFAAVEKNPYSSKEVLELLLNWRGSVQITEEVLLTAGEKQYTGIEVIEFILDQYRRGLRFKITYEPSISATGDIAEKRLLIVDAQEYFRSLRGRDSGSSYQS